MMTQKAWILTVVALAALGLATVGAAKLDAAAADRPDCPGKIVCPQTGELICRDRCPTVDPDRSDCPGRIICPQTGELVCIDRCPLGKAEASGTKPDAVPPCCAGSK